MTIKKYSLCLLLLPTLLLGSCKKGILQLNNPTEPTPGGSLVTEPGIDAFAQGIYEKWVAFETGDGNLDFFDIAWLMEANMGDEDFSPYSNFGGRYPMNISQITLPAPYNTVINNPSGFATQLDILEDENSRTAGDGNSIQYEWDCFYYVNAQANFLLKALSNPALTFSGDAVTKKALLTAWAYYWKGYCYSKLGSMYIAALIDDSPDSTSLGLTSNVYVVHDSVISAATRNFQTAISIFGSITEDADYDATFQAIVPSFNLPNNIITPAMWVRQIYSFEARNYMANIKVAAMASSDWQNILNLANQGMQQGDYTLEWGMAPSGINDLSSLGGFIFHPLERITVQGGALSFVSERLIQDIQPGDNRFTKGFQPYPGGSVVNVRSRGIQFGTRYGVIDIENGGLYGTENYQGTVPIAPTWEETALMIAEADIYTGNINAGLSLIDQVRASQNAGLPLLAGSGISQDSAISQLHSERRIGLYHHNVAWYDARRWGITAPASAGGGRTGNILVPGSLIGGGSTPATILPCFINYDFTDYWDVPANELNFNPASSNSAPVANTN
jgi:starch-binding outer membrane protein, SusD/RagB family